MSIVVTGLTPLLEVLPRIGTEDSVVISLIAQNLAAPDTQAYASTHQMVLRALGTIGAAARPVLLQVTSFLNHSNPKIRKAAEEALEQINPGGDSALQVRSRMDITSDGEVSAAHPSAAVRGPMSRFRQVPEGYCL